MFNVTLFASFSKPQNSTKQPSGGTNFSCLMVEPCGVLNPRVTFNQGNGWNPSAYNYAYIADFGRYYWINEWTYDASQWIATMSVDPMASWKSQILDLEEYVVRSASLKDGNIIDSFYPAKANVTSNLSTAEVWPTGTLESGTVVLGVIGNNSDSVGGVSYYAISYAQLKNLGSKMFATTDWINGAVAAQDIGEDLLKCLVNPAQYIQSVQWFPVRPTGGGSINTINLGWWSTGLGGSVYAEFQPLLGKIVDSRPAHPKSARGAYLNYAPYTEMYLDIQPFGRITLDPAKYPAGDQINYQIVIDGISGNALLRLYSTANRPEIFTAHVGVNVALAQQTSDVAGAAMAMGNAVGSAFDLNFAGAAAGVADGIAAIAPQPTIIGGNGATVFYNQPARLVCIFHDVVDADTVHFGSPLCSKRKLSSLSNFTQCESADGNLPCTEPEREQIVGFMNGGFFIE